MIILTTPIFADASNGKRIYLKNLKVYCIMSSYRFASTHSQDEWEEIYDAGEFVNEVKKICPMLKSTYQSQWTHDLYRFTYFYANDSDYTANH